MKKTVDKSYEMSNEEAQRYLLGLPNGEVKMGSNNDNEENFNSMRVIKLSNDVFRFFCP